MGVTGEGGGGNDIASFARDALGLNMKVVAGYPDSNALFLAMERGELDGRFVGLSVVRTTQKAWLADNSLVAPVVQFAPERAQGVHRHVLLTHVYAKSDGHADSR